jgi:hypothetical protein
MDQFDNHLITCLPARGIDVPGAKPSNIHIPKLKTLERAEVLPFNDPFTKATLFKESILKLVLLEFDRTTFIFKKIQLD